MERVTGFSQMTCFLCFAASSTYCSWRKVGRQMSTTSTGSAASMASPSAYQGQPAASANARPAASPRSHTAVTLTFFIA